MYHIESCCCSCFRTSCTESHVPCEIRLCSCFMMLWLHDDVSSSVKVQLCSVSSHSTSLLSRLCVFSVSPKSECERNMWVCSSKKQKANWSCKQEVSTWLCERCVFAVQCHTCCHCSLWKGPVSLSSQPADSSDLWLDVSTLTCGFVHFQWEGSLRSAKGRCIIWPLKWNVWRSTGSLTSSLCVCHWMIRVFWLVDVVQLVAHLLQ